MLETDGQIISRSKILKEVGKRGLNLSSVLPADYCDNTITGRWRCKYNFLHSIEPGKYMLSKFK